MKNIKFKEIRFAIIYIFILGFINVASANSCSNKLFSVTIDSQLTIEDVIENLADTCALTVIIKDEATQQRMKKNFYYVKLKNSTLKGFLNTVLEDNDLHYTLIGNKLKISYLITRTFKMHYISGQRIGKSTANVTIANSQNSSSSQGGSGGKGGGSKDGENLSKTGITIESNDKFQFWKTVEKEVQRVLVGAADESMHYTRSGDEWKGSDGKVWEYNPLAPIVNPEAGMITVTGTQRQIDRVAKYIHTLSKQIKQQVLIDVRILSVILDDSRKTGIDWSQLHSLQNFTANSLGMVQNNIASYAFDAVQGITDTEFVANTGTNINPFGESITPPNAGVISITGHAQVQEVIKFLGTQGDVKSISSPRVMTLNNQPAMISVGRELFYKIQSSSTASGSGGAVSAQGELVDSVFAGILLDITPEIDADGMITLKINPSISETVQVTSGSNSLRNIPPDLIRRQIASVVKVEDGDHAILGGLITTKSGLKSNKIPLLGDLPLFGYLFKQEEKIETVEELVLIITPHIIKNGKSISLKDLGYSNVNEK